MLRQLVESMENATLDELRAMLRASFPPLDHDEQKVSVTIYRLLVRNQTVTRCLLAESLRMPLAVVEDMLERWWGIEYDERKRIIGYRGLTTRVTRHCLHVDGQRRYTWCAWDLLFIPGILQMQAHAESASPLTQARIRLELSPQAIRKAVPADTVMSFLVPEPTHIRENVAAHFCRFVYFFESIDAGLAWTSKEPETFLMPIDQAFALGRTFNMIQYPAFFR